MTIPTFEIFLVEIAIVLIVSIATGIENTYANIATNAVITVMAGGTLLYEQKLAGFFLLVYGIFLMTFAVKEYEEEKTRYSGDMLGAAIKILGHYAAVSTVLIAVMFTEYRPEMLTYLSSFAAAYVKP